MKKLYFISTRPWIYLSEIPLVFLLVIAIINNSEAEGVWKLYPLLVALIIGIAFILVYFFRALIISTDEVESFTVFRGRDVATLNKDKTLILKIISKTRISVSVFGHDGAPDIDFIKNDESYKPTDTYLLKATAIGGGGSLVKIMGYFDIPRDVAKELTARSGKYEDEAISVISEKNEALDGEIRITFKKTL